VPDRHRDHDLLWELEPVAERLLDRHLSMAKAWLPHAYVPWSLGRDVVLRDYLLVTRNLDPVALERGRMAVLQQGWTPDKPALGLLAYAAFQELATRISHGNTGRYSNDPVADKIMARSSGRCCAPGACSASKAWTRRPSRRGSGWQPTWPRPTDSPTDSRPNEPPPPPTNTARPAEHAHQRGGPRVQPSGLTSYPIARATAVPVGRDATPSSGNVRTGISPPRQPAAEQTWPLAGALRGWRAGHACAAPGRTMLG
jgi:Fatty acid desaturase